MKTTAKQPESSQAIQAKVNKQSSVNSILQRYKDKTTQRQSTEEEELLQGKFETAQKMELDEEEPFQGKFETTQLATEEEEEPLQRLPNNTGLPDNLKSGIENLSGYSMDDVKVHYNSSQPATLQAHAYAQGTDIHIAPGQEKHLPHEAWHVVQQKQGRVKPTKQLKGEMNINDDAGLEKEADVMGNKIQLATMNAKSNENHLKMNQYPISIVTQAVVYSEEDYQKKKDGFVTKAKQDLELEDLEEDKPIINTLNELKEHDSTTVIDNIEHLKSLIGIDHSAYEEQFQQEFNIVNSLSGKMHAPADRLKQFKGGEKAEPESDTEELKSFTTEMTEIPLQDTSLTKTQEQLDSLKNTLKSAPKTIQAQKDKKIISTVTSTGTKVHTWSTQFPNIFVNSMRKWRIKGSIGATNDRGNYLAIGPKSDTLEDKWKSQDKRGAVIRATTWSPGINDTWIKSGIKKQLPFQLTRMPSEAIISALRSGDLKELETACKEHAQQQDNPLDSYYWNLSTSSYTRFGVELVELLKSGYRLDETF